MRARDVTRGTGLEQRLARQAPRQRRREIRPAVALDAQPRALVPHAPAGLRLDQGGDPLRVPALRFGQIRDPLEETRVELPCEPRDPLPPEPVACEVRARVRGVLAPAEVRGEGVGLDLGTSDPQQRAHEPPVGRALGDARKAVGAGAAKEAQENGLGLIAGMVGRCDRTTAVRPRERAQRCIAEHARGFLEAGPTPARSTATRALRVHRLDSGAEPVLQRELLDEALIGIGVGAA